MGAWGFRIEDNDTAQDFKLACEELTRDGVELYDAIEDVINREWFINDSEAILMAGKLEYDFYKEVRHTYEVKLALKHELTSERLENWTNPHERKRELLLFMDCLV